ncbi:LEPR-XLL domain-containing protein [Parendozoicomonas sp. Alg238-R29]|uniref:beta strand repeat-containing protein n=1 Tax=Parendozoicomonas sp. Alg238-R29 TaxID=2993446 RepID=UPI00248E0C8F|nr:LEPR-XLL domain-containing protein [Parendozoicomonas sp. Alg238-R29]
MDNKIKKHRNVSHGLELLEERILLSADPLMLPLTVESPETTEIRLMEKPSDQESGSRVTSSLQPKTLSSLASQEDNIAIDDQLVETDKGLVIEPGQKLTGNGDIRGHLVSHGVMGPGNSPGVVKADSVQYTNTSELIIEIGGTAEGEFDQVQIDGLANLDGKLSIKLINGYELQEGDSFQVMTYGDVEGTFASADGLFAMDGDGSGYFQIEQTDTGIKLVYRKLGNELKINFASTDSANTFGEQLNSHYFASESSSVRDQAIVEFADFIYFQGSIKIDAAVAHDITVATGFSSELGLPSELTIDRTYLTISVTNASGFIGYGGPAQIDRNFDGKFDGPGETNSHAKGLSFKDASFGMAYFNLPADFLDLDISLPDLPSLPDVETRLANSLPNFYALKAEIGSFELVGFDSLFSLNADKLVISINDGGNWLPLSGPAIDFQKSFGQGLSVPVVDDADPIVLGFGGSQTMKATLINGRMSLLNFVHVYGDLNLEKGRTSTVDVVTGLPSDISGLLSGLGGAADFLSGLDDPSVIKDLEVSGFSIAGTNLKAFVGINGGFEANGNPSHDNASGLLLDGVTFAYLDLSPTRPDLSDLMNFTAMSATAEQVAVIGIDGLTVEASDIRIDINSGTSWPGNAGTPVIDFQNSFKAEATDTDGDGKVDPAGYELLVDNQSLYIDHAGSELVAASLMNATLNAAGFVAAKGDFSFRKGATHTVKVKDNTGTGQERSVEVESLQIGGQDITVFAGIGDLGFLGVDGLNSGSTGMLLEGVDFAYASFTPTAASAVVFNASFQALSVRADKGRFIGLGDIAEFTDVSINLNTGKLRGETVKPSIDFSNSDFGDPLGYAVSTSSDPDDKLYLNFTDHLQLISAHGVLDLAGVAEVEGDFAFSKVKAVDVDVKSNLQKWGAPAEFSLSGEIDVLAISVTNATVSMNLGVVEAELTDANVGLFIGTPTPASLVSGVEKFVPKFIAIKAITSSASFKTGLGDDFKVIDIQSEKSLELEANFTYFPKLDPKTQAAILALGAPAIDFTSSFDGGSYLLPAVEGEEPIAMDFSSQAFNLLIEQASIEIYVPGITTPAVSITGGVAISKLSSQTVTLTDGSTLESVDGVTLVGKNLEASVNLGGLGLDLGVKAELGLALLADLKGVEPGLTGLFQPDFYLAMTSQLDASALSEIPIVDIPGLGFELKGAQLNINTKLNHDFSDGIDVPSVDFSKSYQGETVSGVDLNGNGHIAQTGLVLVTTRENVVDSAVLLNFSDQLIGLRGQAVFTFDLLPSIKLDGTFQLDSSGEITQILFDGTLAVNYGAGSLNFNAKGVIYSKIVVDPENPASITDQELAISLQTQGGFDVPGLIGFDGSLNFVANTTSRDITFTVADDFQPLLGYSSVTIPGTQANVDESAGQSGPYFALSANEGSLTLVDQFFVDIEKIIISGDTSGLILGVKGNIGLFGLGSFGATGNILLGQGIKTNLALNGEAEIFELVTVSGNMMFNLEATKNNQSVSVGISDTTVAFWTLFELKPGDITFAYSNGIFSVQNLGANVEVPGLKGAVNVQYLKSNGDFKFYFTVKAGLNASFGPVSVGASATATLKLMHSSGEFDLDSDLRVTASVGTKAIKAFGATIVPAFRQSGTIRGGLDLSFDPNDGELSIGADLFGKIDVSIPIGFRLPLPDAPPPNVAAKTGDVVDIHVGQKSHLRNYDREDVNETIRIRQQGDTLTVDVQGKITKLKIDENDTIRIDGGNGLDRVVVDSSVTADVEFLNVGTISYSGSGHALITGTSGDDSIRINGNGTTVINSADGNDTIVINDSKNAIIDAGTGNDSITLYGAGSHTLTPGTGDDSIRTFMAGGSLTVVLAEGFGNDDVGGNGVLSRLDMSQVRSDINLEYDQLGNKFSMHSAAGTVSLGDVVFPESDEIDGEDDSVEEVEGNIPKISHIDFGSGNDTYVIVAASDMTLTENGGSNTFYYVDQAGGDVIFNGNSFTLNGSTITFDTGIDQLHLGNIDYEARVDSERFAGIDSAYLGSGSETLTLRTSSSTYALNSTQISLYANSLVLANNFSAADWTINTRFNAQFNGDLTATVGDITLSQTEASGSVTVSGNISAQSGDIEFDLAGSLVQTSGTIAAEAAGRTLRIHSTDSVIRQLDGSRVLTNNGDIELQSHGDMFIAHVNAETGEVTLTSQTGGVFDAGDADLDLIAENVSFTIFAGFGENNNAIDSEINRISGSAKVGSISLQNTNDVTIDGEGLNINGNGNVLVRAQQGDLIVDNAVNIAGAGNIRLESSKGSVAANASLVIQSADSVSLLADRNITQLAGTNIQTSDGGSIDLFAKQGSVSQADGAVITAGASGSLRVEAGVSIGVSSMKAGGVSLTAGTGSVSDSGDLYKDIEASQLRMDAGTGIGKNNSLEIATDKLAVRTGQDGVSLLEDDDVAIDTLAAIHVDRVNIDGSTAAVTDESLSDIVTRSNGSVDLETVDGSIRVFDGGSPDNKAGIYADGSGDIRLDANGVGQDVIIERETQVSSQRGSVEITAADSIVLDNNAEVSIEEAAQYQSLTLTAEAGSVTQRQDSKISTYDSSVGITAKNDVVQMSGADIAITETSQNNSLDIVAETGSVLQRESSRITTFDSGLNITASVDVVQAQNAEIAVQNSALDNALNITAQTGSVLQAENSRISSENSSVNITARNNVIQDKNSDISIRRAAPGNKLNLTAQTGNITQVDTSHISAINSDVSLYGKQDIDVADVSTSGAKVTMTAELGGIYDVGESDIDVTAAELQFTSDKGFGTDLNDIDTEVQRVHGSVNEGSINIQEQDNLDIISGGLNIGSSGNILVSNKTGDVSTSGDVRVGQSGNILLKSDHGNINVGASVTTNSGQAITLQAKNSIDLQSSAQVTTLSGGTIDLLAEQGSIRQSDGSALTTALSGSIRLQAADSIALAALNAGTGNASLTTGSGSVTDSGDSQTDIVARQLRIDAGTGAGTNNALETSVDRFAGHAGSGGLHINEDNDIEINTLTDISIQRVQLDGSARQVTDQAISDLRTDNNGSVTVTTAGGTITVDDGTIPDDGVGIYAQGNGSIRLEAGGAGEDVRIKEDTDLVSDTGNISVLAQDAVLQEAGADLRVTQDGDITVQTLDGSIYMTDGTIAETSGDGNIVYRAKAHVDLSRLSGQAHTTVIAETGQIRDNLQIGEGSVDYDSKIDPQKARSVDSLHTTVVVNGVEYYGDVKIGQLFNEQSNITSQSLSMIANQGIGILGVQDIDIEVEQLEMVNKADNHVFVQEENSVNVFGQGARNMNSDGDLMFSTISGELYIGNENIRNRGASYSTEGQLVSGYTIDGYTLEDFYLDEGVRIVNGLVHTGEEGYLYVRSAIGDWGPMNYDQLADELSRNRNTDSAFQDDGEITFIGDSLFDENVESESPVSVFDSGLEALRGGGEPSEQAVTRDAGVIAINEISPLLEGIDSSRTSELLTFYINQISGPASIDLDFNALPATQAGEGDFQSAESVGENSSEKMVSMVLQAITTMFGDQQLSVEEMYVIYTRMMSDQSSTAIDFDTFAQLVKTYQA